MMSHIVWLLENKSRDKSEKRFLPNWTYKSWNRYDESPKTILGLMPKTLFILDNDFHMYFLYQPLFLNKQTENDVLYFRTPWGSLIYINDSSIRQFYVLLLSILRSHHMRIFYQIGNWTVFHGVFTGTKRKNRGCWISLWSIRTNWKWRWSFKASIQSKKCKVKN